jgi:putative membrane protein
LSGLTLTLLLIVAYVAVAALLAPAALAGTVGAVVPALLTVGRRFAIEFGFTVAASPDGLRLRHGLLETRSQTVPDGRVQAVRIVEPLLWRPLGWVRVEVDVAGYRRGHGAEERIATSALLPVAPRADADAVLGLVFRDLFRSGPGGPAGDGGGSGANGGGLRLDALPTAPPPRRALLRAPLSWHFLGFAVDARWAVSSGGRLRRTTDVVPHGKVQSLRLVQGPVSRRLRLATVHLDTAGRDVHAAARFRDAAEAGRLLGELTDLARARRREQGILAPPVPPPARPADGRGGTPSAGTGHA